MDVVILKNLRGQMKKRIECRIRILILIFGHTIEVKKKSSDKSEFQCRGYSKLYVKKAIINALRKSQFFF